MVLGRSMNEVQCGNLSVSFRRLLNEINFNGEGNACGLCTFHFFFSCCYLV